jgi:prolyl-tRNA editing enzyme YbaK/EbsC (Cys-tRNA(Pro) deacylase)
MKDALTLHRYLLDREIQHEIVRLPGVISNADELPRMLGLSPNRCLVTRMYGFGRNDLLAAIVPAESRPPLEAVQTALGTPRLVRRAPADAVNKATDYVAELVAPLLLPEDMPILLDEELVDALDVDDVVYTATGEGSTALGIRAIDLFSLTGAKPCTLAGPLRSSA